MKIWFRLYFWFLLVSVLVPTGCASMDTRKMDVRVDVMRGAAYQAFKPRIPVNEFLIFDQTPDDRQFKIVGNYIGQETDVVILPRSVDEIMIVIAEKAWDDGADACIKESHDTRKVTGKNRDTLVVKMKCIRFVPLR